MAPEGVLSGAASIAWHASKLHVGTLHFEDMSGSVYELRTNRR